MNMPYLKERDAQFDYHSHALYSTEVTFEQANRLCNIVINKWSATLQNIKFMAIRQKHHYYETVFAEIYQQMQKKEWRK